MKTLPRPLRWIVLGIALAFIAIQFFPAGRTNPPIKSALSAPTSVDAVLRRACYDCHSHETKWPLYSYVAPMSWFVIKHVNRGRGDLNFSEWPAFDLEAQEHAFGDIVEQIEKGEMPLDSYTLIHRQARLSAEDRETLLRWARSRGLGD